MKIGIPIWGSRVSPVFDTARRLLVVDVADGKESSRTTENLHDTAVPGRAREIHSQGVDVLLCGAISRPLAGMIANYGITVMPWMSGDSEEVLSAYLTGTLSDERFAMPGCRGRRRRFCGGRRAPPKGLFED